MFSKIPCFSKTPLKMSPCEGQQRKQPKITRHPNTATQNLPTVHASPWEHPNARNSRRTQCLPPHFCLCQSRLETAAQDGWACSNDHIPFKIFDQFEFGRGDECACRYGRYVRHGVTACLKCLRGDPRGPAAMRVARAQWAMSNSPYCLVLTADYDDGLVWRGTPPGSVAPPHCCFSVRCAYSPYVHTFVDPITRFDVHLFDKFVKV